MYNFSMCVGYVMFPNLKIITTYKRAYSASCFQNFNSKMGKKDKNKKKGKGAEKTAAKTEKKESNKMKKKLAALGENDVEAIIAEIEKEDSKRQQVKILKVEPPSRRINFSFAPHPDKEELFLFGGEFFNGQKTFLYNDLFFYTISNGTWSLIKAPGGPPPRCGHQMVTTSANKGQLWVFGGEFASPTQSQFYHYRDLWVFHLATNQWEKITSPNGPSARSGHRMVYLKKQLILFGGFHDNLRDYKYYNDVYSFNTETYKWTKLEPSGTPPAPRSSCCMIPLVDGKVLLYGGYSKEKIKKDVDKGHVFSDAFLLVPDKTDTTGTKWKWTQTKLGGLHFTQRSGLSCALAPNNTAYAFGGVFDVEEEETLNSTFFNELYMLDLGSLAWRNVTLAGKKEKDNKTRRRRDKNAEETGESVNDDEEMDVDDNVPEPAPTVVADDGIFTVTVGPASASSSSNTLTVKPEKLDSFQPSARMNCGVAVKHGVLYLYGGMFEDGDRQFTLNDFYSVDLRKLDEWKTIASDDQAQEWLESESESGEESESEEESSEEDENDTSDKETMHTD